MRVKQLLELEHQSRALQRRGFAPSREGCFAAATAVATSAAFASGTRAATRPRASGALTVDEMTQLAHPRGTLICFPQMSSNCRTKLKS
jgi:hypothetical protein